MLTTLTAIVLATYPYSESSLIVQVYARDHGAQSWLVNSVRKPKPKFSQSLFQPLTLLEAVVYLKPNGQLLRVSELRCPAIYHTLPYDIKKTSITLFLAEVLSKLLRQYPTNPELFDFLAHCTLGLDAATEDYESSHLYILAAMLTHLGLGPIDGPTLLAQIHGVAGADYSEPELIKLLDTVLAGGNGAQIELNKHQRNAILDLLIRYLRSQFVELGSLKSQDILSVVLS